MKQSPAKTFFLSLIFCFTAAIQVDAQGAAPLAITFNVLSYPGGYNISCHGLHDGDIDATIVGGVPPYTYSWSNSETVQDIHSLGAGMYTLIVTDALGHTDTNAVTLYEADLLAITLTPSLSNGYNISAAGGNDGTIDLDIAGGAPPYTYSWSNGDSIEDITDLTAGTYSVVTTDQNGCTATAGTTMIQPSPISYTITSHKDVKCYGGSDGEIRLSVSGGVPPYQFHWSNGSLTKNQLNIPEGTYTGVISDANKVAHDTVVVIITQPADLTVALTPSVYPNGYNVECIDCQNGSITSAVSGGTSPFSYQWLGGQTTANLTGQDIQYNSLTVTDANSCTTNASVFLSGPLGAAWDKDGNTGDSTKFLGTVNSAPLIFKTNGSERMRILPDGKAGIGTSNPLAKLDVNGDLRATGSITFGADKKISYTPASGAFPAIFSYGTPPVLPLDPGGGGPCFFPMLTSIYANQFSGMLQSHGLDADGNRNILNMGFDGANGIIDIAGGGTDPENPFPRLLINYYCGKDVYMCTGSRGGKIVMAVGTDNGVAIGDEYIPAGYKLAVKGKIIAEEVRVKLRGSWPDYVFEPGYTLRTIPELENYLKENRHLPEIPAAKTVEKEGINTSEMIAQLLKQQEELTLYIIEQNKRIEELEKKIK